MEEYFILRGGGLFFNFWLMGGVLIFNGCQCLMLDIETGIAFGKMGHFGPMHTLLCCGPIFSMVQCSILPCSYVYG